MEVFSVVFIVLFFLALYSYFIYREILYCKKLIAETKFFNASADEVRKFD